MSCYICLEEKVHTPDIGTCAHCSLHACGKPPQRRDLLFHGDVCAIYSCGVFYCERHLHTHTHTSHGGSHAFPSMAFSAGVRVVAAGAALEGVQDPRPELTRNQTYRRDINRYLNVIAPGSDALRDLLNMIPEGTYEIVAVEAGTVVRFLPDFFTRKALSAVSRMALRSVWISAWALQPARIAPAARAHLSQWIGSLGEPPMLSHVDLDAEESGWIEKTVRQLPAGRAVEANVEGVPPESAPTELARFFLSQRDEGMQEEVMRAF
jgi:hypothetical protein